MARFTELFTELVRVEIELWNDLDAHLLETAGLSLPQHQALSAIRAHGATARVQDVSKEMAITVGATSKVIDRLERDGLAARSAHPTDRRSSLISITERGASALDSADAAAETHLRAVLGARLTNADADALLVRLTSLRTQALAGVDR